ncbi:hypothetical protein FACS1894187_19330 [Synergistales bacterium]|nr:hypothetical protein FACS1894187_19330 [Synergistales bacterium]
MDKKNADKAIEEAVDRIFREKEEDPAAYTPSHPDSYAKTVSLAYEKITSLRDMGIGYDKICASFEISGLLPHPAAVHSFSQAFRREKAKRQDKTVQNIKTSESNKIIPYSTKKIVVKESIVIDDKAEQDRERIEQLTNATVDTGLGTIIKHPDGSFEY